MSWLDQPSLGDASYWAGFLIGTPPARPGFLGCKSIPLRLVKELLDIMVHFGVDGLAVLPERVLDMGYGEQGRGAHGADLGHEGWIA